MNTIGKSYRKVHYELRPAKQVERRMLLHAFHELRGLGYSISQYEYTGMGSIYFIDFTLFHRYLGLTHMTSVEDDEDIKNRVVFNRPYRLVKVVHDDVAAHISRLSLDRQHILWLDFDSILTRDLLDAVQLAAAQLSKQSILLVTVDVEPPGRPEEGLKKWNPRAWMRHYEEHADSHLWRGATIRDFTVERLAATNARIIQSVIDEGLREREGIALIGIFSFLYADGHRMLSLGGMIGTEEDRRKLGSLNRRELFFLRDKLTDAPFEIRVPLVTRKERHHLDHHMPRKGNWLPKDFEITDDDIRDYSRIYRYYPAYTEMLL